MDGNDLLQTACLLTRDQHDRLKALATQTHISMSAHIRAAIERLLDDHQRKNKERIREGS